MKRATATTRCRGDGFVEGLEQGPSAPLGLVASGLSDSIQRAVRGCPELFQ